MRFSDNFSTTAKNFQTEFYTPILCSYSRYTTKFCSIISNFDKVMSIKHDRFVNFYISLELQPFNLLTYVAPAFGKYHLGCGLRWSH